LVVADELKPAVLCTLLAGMKQASCVVFVSSVESTETLGHLLSIIEIDTKAIGKVSQYSAAASIQERESALDEFRSGRSKVLVCSDAITRGIDIEGVEAVINYDAPVYPKTYVHRAGRTARAGKAGKVITLLRREDVRHFKAMLRKADNNYVKDEKMDSEQIQKAKGWVEDGLKALRKRLQFSKEEQHKDASSKVTENPKSKRNNTMKKKVKGFPEFII
jgi:ATP-dependent RNA helicase DDX51/DBP6